MTRLTHTSFFFPPHRQVEFVPFSEGVAGVSLAGGKRGGGKSGAETSNCRASSRGVCSAPQLQGNACFCQLLAVSNTSHSQLWAATDTPRDSVPARAATSKQLREGARGRGLPGL